MFRSLPHVLYLYSTTTLPSVSIIPIIPPPAIVDIGIDRTVAMNLHQSTLCIVEEMHPVISAIQKSWPHTIQDVPCLYAVHDFCYLQAVVVVLILNVYAILTHLSKDDDL